MNYESIIEEELIHTLKNKFNIKNTQILFCYLRCRYYIVKNTTKYISDDFILFILETLNINKLEYKEETLYLHYSKENSLQNIFDYYEYLYKEEYIDSILNCSYKLEQKEKDILKKVNNNVSLIKNKIVKDLYYDKYILYYKLQELNNIFKINLNTNFIKIEGFQQSDNLCLELELERYIKAMKFNNSNLNEIKEKDLETYLINHLDLIEDGLTFQTRQYHLDEGIIDILAKDKDDNIVIIELKIEDDKKIIWQSMYYPKQIKKKFNSKVRMITIMPFYPKYLLDILNDLNIEKFSYNIKISNNKIVDLTLKKEE